MSVIDSGIWDGLWTVLTTIFVGVVNFFKSFSAGGMSLWTFILAFFVLSVFISVFWKGGDGN